MYATYLPFVFLLLAFGAATAMGQASPKRVGVVDEKLVSQENWVAEWAKDWSAAKIVELFRAHGLEAEVVGVDILKDPTKLKTFTAIMVPTDHSYPDAGDRVGPIAHALREYVKAGGIYILPMGGSQARWKDVETGRVSEDMGFRRDYLGFTWLSGGDHKAPGPALQVTEIGREAGIHAPEFPFPVASFARFLAPMGLVFVTNADGKPCLYASSLGSGAVIHYAGGLPLDAKVRDWLVDT
jgi:hypothetical protein